MKKEFKKGDLVRCIHAPVFGALITKGNLYMVAEDQSENFVTIIDDNGERRFYAPTRFELAKQPTAETLKQTEMERIFKKGDLVECIENSNYTTSLTNGKIYEVLDCFLYNHPYYIYIKCDNGETFWLNPFHFKLHKAIDDKKKIIGYKCPYDLLGGKIPKGTLYDTYSVDRRFLQPNEIHTALLPKEIVETWEPVYKEECKEKEFTLKCNGGSFNLTVTKKGFLYKPDNKYLDPLIIEQYIKNSLASVYQGYIFCPIITHLDMGCKKNVPVEDIKPLIKYWEENFKK